MRPFLGLALAAPMVIGSVVVACNAITGVGSLGTCDGCVDTTAPDHGDGGSGGDGPKVVAPSDGGELPATCSGNEVACAGKVSAQCVGDNWVKTTCTDTCVAGKCESWPSCKNAAGAGCGAGAAKSCCASATVPGGTFNRRNLGGPGNGIPATVSSFDLDAYEVTVGRMRAFVQAGGATQATPPASGAGAHPKIANSGWQSAWNGLLPADVTALRTSFTGGNATWTDLVAANEHLPINNVSWFVAFAFCAWDGARLPTYAEWDFAASGGGEQRQYPWSASATSTDVTALQAAYECRYSPPARACAATHCSDNSSSPCDATTCISPLTCVTPACTGCVLGDIAPVGLLTAGAGKWGHFDLAGNVAELVLDVDNDNGAFNQACVDCAALPPTAIHGPPSHPRLDANFLAAGGGWDSAVSGIRTSVYTTERDDSTNDSVGFRCAR